MSFFGFRTTADTYGVIIDIGSGSVLVSIVHSNPAHDHPSIVWAHREHAPLRNIDSIEQSAKAVMTSLVNTSMMIDAEGRHALYDYDSTAKLTSLQCSIAAPWSYTVTKTINYKQDQPFSISEDLLNELFVTVQEKITADLLANEAASDLDLEVITTATMGIQANGYPISKPAGEKATQLSISSASAVTQKYLIAAIDEMHDKLFPATTFHKISFILMFYSIVKDLLPQKQDICLIDVTYEATEIGVVRDGILHYCTHSAFGIFSLAREVAEITSVPLHEAYGYLRTETPYSFIETLPKKQQAEVTKTFQAYVDRIAELFRETGDSLSIPKNITLHTDIGNEPLFIDLIEQAAKRTLKSSPVITAISQEIIKQTYKNLTNKSKTKIPADTALLLSAQFFHKQGQHQRFEYL